jgi:hypothetical protein
LEDPAFFFVPEHGAARQQSRQLTASATSLRLGSHGVTLYTYGLPTDERPNWMASRSRVDTESPMNAVACEFLSNAPWWILPSLARSGRRPGVPSRAGGAESLVPCGESGLGEMATGIRFVHLHPLCGPVFRGRRTSRRTRRDCIQREASLLTWRPWVGGVTPA